MPKSPPYVQQIVDAENQAIRSFHLPVIAKHLLQMGALDALAVTQKADNLHRIPLTLSPIEDRKEDVVYTDLMHLPFATKSLDFIILQRALEFVPDVNGLMQEVERVLTDKGCLIVTGINVLGFWKRAAKQNQLKAKRFLTPYRVKQQLEKLGLTVVKTDLRLFSLPKWYPCRPVEKIAKLICPFFGGVYVVLACKQVLPATPIRSRWNWLPRFSMSPNLRPSTRSLRRKTP